MENKAASEKSTESDASTPSKKQKLMSHYVNNIEPKSSESTGNKIDNKSNSNKLLIDYEKRLNVTSTMSLGTNKKCPDDDAIIDQNRKFIEMSERKERIKVPDESTYSKFVSLQNHLKHLLSITPRPNDFFHQAMILQKETQGMIPEIENSFQNINAVVDALNCSILGMSKCYRSSDFVEGCKWEYLNKIMISIGVKDYVDGIENKRKQQKEMKSNLKISSARKKHKKIKLLQQMQATKKMQLLIRTT